MAGDTGPPPAAGARALPRLGERLAQVSGTLSGGEQQMLAIARALCSGAEVLLLDEPTEGLQPSMIALIRDTVAAPKATGVATLLVEQRVDAALAVADRIAFMAAGRVAETVEASGLTARAAVPRLCGGLRCEADARGSGSSGIVAGVDVGGTFTDLLSSTPPPARCASPRPRPRRRTRPSACSPPWRRRRRLADDRPDRARHPTTTNAVLERRLARTGLITTSWLPRRARARPPHPPAALRHDRPLHPVIPRDLRLEVPERMDARAAC